MWTPGLRQLSVSELNQTLEEVEAAIRRYSEELIKALALRDELDFEKEVRCSESIKQQLLRLVHHEQPKPAASF